MMRTRKGHKVYPLTVAQKFSSLLRAPLPEHGGSEYRNKSDNRGGSGLGSAEEINQ